MPVAEKLDPFTAYLPYRLYRESTRSVKGKVVKVSQERSITRSPKLISQDLAYLNRDLSKVIMLDTNAEHSSLQPENAIVIKPWEGKGGERGLVDLIPFLECEQISPGLVSDIKRWIRAPVWDDL
jgi:import inner membrane translocase subunit TIM50